MVVGSVRLQSWVDFAATPNPCVDEISSGMVSNKVNSRNYFLPRKYSLRLRRVVEVKLYGDGMVTDHSSDLLARDYGSSTHANVQC